MWTLLMVTRTLCTAEVGSQLVVGLLLDYLSSVEDLLALDKILHNFLTEHMYRLSPHACRATARVRYRVGHLVCFVE